MFTHVTLPLPVDPDSFVDDGGVRLMLTDKLEHAVIFSRLLQIHIGVIKLVSSDGLESILPTFGCVIHCCPEGH